MIGQPLVMTESGRSVLAFPTGVSAADFVRSEIGSLQREPGWIASRSAVRPWPIEGFTQRDGQIHFWGQHLPGVALEDCLGDDPRTNLGRLADLCAALQRLAAEKAPHVPLRTDAVFFLEDGSVLFMPPGMMQRIAMLRPFDERVRTYNVINNPDLSASRAHAYSVGALAYRMILGAWPFVGEDDVEVNRKIRAYRITPPAIQRPEILPELSDAIVQSLNKDARTPPDLAAWEKLLRRAAADGHTRVVSPENQKVAAEAAARWEARARATYRRTVFFQKNWRLMVIVGGILAVVGSVLGSVLSNVLAPRVTRGFAPQLVVETFYNSMNTLDHTTMEDTVVDKAGQGEINEAMNLFVLTRVTMGYEGVSYVRNAREWDEEGRPALNPPETLYGAILREVTQLQGEPNPVYRVTYEKWAPLSGDDVERTGQGSEGFHRVDRVSLRKDKGDWVIYEIARLEDTPVRQ